MAAGNAFGRNKLEENVGGVRIIHRALEAVPRGELVRVVVVSQYAEIEALAAEYGFLAVHNGDPGAGLSHTVALGLAALADCDAVLFQVADQPLLRRGSIRRKSPPSPAAGGVETRVSSLPASSRSCSR